MKVTLLLALFAVAFCAAQVPGVPCDGTEQVKQCSLAGNWKTETQGTVYGRWLKFNNITTNLPAGFTGEVFHRYTDPSGFPGCNYIRSSNGAYDYGHKVGLTVEGRCRLNIRFDDLCVAQEQCRPFEEYLEANNLCPAPYNNGFNDYIEWDFVDGEWNCERFYFQGSWWVNPASVVFPSLVLVVVSALALF